MKQNCLRFCSNRILSIDSAYTAIPGREVYEGPDHPTAQHRRPYPRVPIIDQGLRQGSDLPCSQYLHRDSWHALQLIWRRQKNRPMDQCRHQSCSRKWPWLQVPSLARYHLCKPSACSGVVVVSMAYFLCGELDHSTRYRLPAQHAGQVEPSTADRWIRCRQYPARYATRSTGGANVVWMLDCCAQSTISTFRMILDRVAGARLQR